MTKFTRADITLELTHLSQYPAACYYLESELRRREASKNNKGRAVRFSDEKHVRNRLSAAKSRANKK